MMVSVTDMAIPPLIGREKVDSGCIWGGEEIGSLFRDRGLCMEIPESLSLKNDLDLKGISILPFTYIAAENETHILKE